jgi:hypothetical protein
VRLVSCNASGRRTASPLASQIYNCEKLTLVLVGPQLRHTIRCVAVKGDLTLAATGVDIVESRRTHRRAVGITTLHGVPAARPWHISLRCLVKRPFHQSCSVAHSAALPCLKVTHVL